MRHVKFPLFALLAVLVVGIFSSSALAATQAEDDDAPVLPTRVANPIHRAQLALDKSIEFIDTGDTVKAVAALKAVRANMVRADKAARVQMNAVPPVDDGGEDTEEPVTFGPDSVVAVLTLDYQIVTTVAGLFDTKAGIVVDGLSPLLFATLNARDSLLNAVIALDPEAAGADYADVMADILPNFDDEVANLNEGVEDDTLSAGGTKVLTKALAQSQRTQAKVALAFGGGE
jgi:hypothetical protein